MKWSDADLAVLRARYPHEPTRELAKDLGRGERAVYQQALKIGLRKTREYLASPIAGRWDGKRGGATRFKPGHESWNKGVKGSSGTHPNCRPTQFKPGQRQGVAVKLWKPVGTERISKDGYLERKVAELDATGLTPVEANRGRQRLWRAVHVLVWEEANGPLPKGHAVVFRNGDRTDRRLENLECVTRKELMLRNSYHRYPQPIPKLIQLRGALNRQVNKRAGREKRNRGSAQPPVRGP